MAFHRLIELQATLAAVIAVDEARDDADRKVIIGDRKAKEKSIAMISIIKSAVFWQSLLRYVNSKI